MSLNGHSMAGLLRGGLPIWKSRNLIQFVFSISILTFSGGAVCGQDTSQNSIPSQFVYNQQEVNPGSTSQWYAGAKVGLIYLFGLELQYNLSTNGIRRIYLAAAVQSSLVVNSANIGGGVFLGKTGLGLGCRYHHLLWFESEADSKIQPGYGPEIIWAKKIGEKNLVNLHAGGIITEGVFFPDISFGWLIPLK